MENLTENFFFRDQDDTVNTFFLENFEDVSMDSLPLGYSKSTVEELQAANKTIKRMKQNEEEKNVFSIAELKAQLLSSLNDLEVLEQKQTFGAPIKLSSITGRPFPTKSAPPPPSFIRYNFQKPVTVFSLPPTIPEQSNNVSESIGAAIHVANPHVASNSMDTSKVNNNDILAKITKAFERHQRMLDDFDSTPQVKLQQNQVPSLGRSPVTSLSFSDMLEPQMSTADQLNKNLDSIPILRSDNTTHYTEAFGDVLSKPSVTSNNFQEVNTLTSSLENIHDVHHKMTLNDSANNNSITHNTHHEVINELSTVPFRDTDGQSVTKLKKHKSPEETKFQPISENINVQGPLGFQSNRADHGQHEEANPNPPPSTIEEIKFGLNEKFFQNSPITKSTPALASSDDEAFYSSLDPTQEALLMRMLKRPVRDPDRVLDVPICNTPDSVKSEIQVNNDLIRRDEAQDSASNSNYRVPAKLPRFRGAPGGITDPEEFLEIFGRNCTAYGVPIQRFPAIMATCLDNINARWFESYLGSLNGNVHWHEIATTFCNHFQNPNITMEWLAQLRSLKMDKDGIQRYSDQFINLAQKLNWNLGDDMVIYQYKSGLSTWMLDQLSVAESNHLLALETHSNNSIRAITVEILAKLAIRIEANKAIRRREPQHEVPSTDKQFKIHKKCSFCGFNGHTDDVCRKKQSNITQTTVSGVNDFRKSDGNRQIQTNKTEVAIQQGNRDTLRVPSIPNNKIYRDKSTLTCFRCNKKGHIAPECTSSSPSPNIKRLEIVDQVSAALESVFDIKSNVSSSSRDLERHAILRVFQYLAL
jgi:hypothetical protein